jgi:hypothetical protein
LLVQELYIYHDRERRITKRYPSYECFTPTDDWSSRPRVLTYLRKGVGLQVEQARPLPLNNIATRDLLFLAVMVPSEHNILVINIYNTPIGSIGDSIVVKLLYTSLGLLPPLLRF